MKKAIILLLGLFLLPMAALGEGDAAADFRHLLVSSFGYTEEEAADFQMELTIEGNKSTVRGWPKDRPEWVYTDEEEIIRDSGMKRFQELSPFESGPGIGREGNLRRILREEKEQGWFKNWEQGGRDAFWIRMEETEYIQYHFLSKEHLPQVTPGQALDFLFQLMMNHPVRWTPALWQWYEEERAARGINETSNAYTALYLEDGVYARTPYALHLFREEIPMEFQAAFSHPQLEGWQFLSGAVDEFGKSGSATGLGAFGKGEERLLVMIKRNNNDPAWRTYPVGMPYHLQGKDILISCAHDAALFIVDLSRGTMKEHLLLSPESVSDTIAYLRIEEYSQSNTETGEGFRIYENQFVTYQPGQEPVYQTLPGWVLGFASDERDLPLPAAYEECLTYDPPLPEGYRAVGGVHLREKTSSHSRNLGEFYTGALVKMTGTLSGDPYPWYQVEIGFLKGYMASNYADLTHRPSSLRPQDCAPLKVAQTTKKTPLRWGTGLLDSKKRDVQPGEKMHLLAMLGDYYYVSIPCSGQPGRFIDAEGEYGYIHKNDVKIAGTALQLDWLQ